MKVLLVEDDQVTGSTLVASLTAHHYTVDWVTDGYTAQAKAEAFEYDLILLDVMLPKLSGIELCQYLRDREYTHPILLLTAKDSSSDRVIGLDAGADDYMIKPFDLPELLARLRALVRRGKGVASSVIFWENLRFDAGHSEVTYGDRPIHLTPKEYCLLELFLLNPKRVFSRSAILDRLWDFAESPGEDTVSTHIKCLRQKLKAAGSADPIETVHGLGYRLRSPTSSLSGQSPSGQSLSGPSLSGQSPSSQSASGPSAASAATQESQIHQRMQSITTRVWTKFKDKLISQVTVIEQAASALMLGQLSETLRIQAEQVAHKLAGSLGIFGAIEGSKLAKRIEVLLQEPTLTIAQSQVLNQQLSQLKQELAQEPQLPLEAEPSDESPMLLIVDDDLLLAEHIRIEAIAWNLRVEIATDLTVARKMIAQAPPDVVLLDLCFPGAGEDGLSLLQELGSRRSPIPVLAFTGRESLSDRVSVARLGGCAFLQKPLPAQQILKVVMDTLQRTPSQAGYRIMAVDDDSSFLSNLVQQLHPWGIDVVILDNPVQFWDYLTGTSPDLLLLDVQMPCFNGLDLCKVIRNDPRWQHLPVLFLSAHTSSEMVDQAFAAGGDDYLSKTASGKDLALNIIRRLRPSLSSRSKTISPLESSIH